MISGQNVFTYLFLNVIFLFTREVLRASLCHEIVMKSGVQ